jgi:hypothetical protein
MKKTMDNNAVLNEDTKRQKYFPSTIEDESEEIKLLEYWSKDADNDVVWNYPGINYSQGLTPSDHHDCKCSNLS